MKRVLPITSMVVVGASAAMWLSSKPNRLKAENVFRDWKRKIKPSPFEKSEQLPIEKGGFSHPHDIPDNNMVSEGAMYSVKFFNEKMQ